MKTTKPRFWVDESAKPLHIKFVMLFGDKSKRDDSNIQFDMIPEDLLELRKELDKVIKAIGL